MKPKKMIWKKNYDIKFDQVVDDSSQQATWYEQSIIDIIWIPEGHWLQKLHNMDCDFSFNPK